MWYQSKHCPATNSLHFEYTLLAGLFLYDVFWVFFTPVMVSVAKNFEAPIKLLFPRYTVDGAMTCFVRVSRGGACGYGCRESYLKHGKAEEAQRRARWLFRI